MTTPTTPKLGLRYSAANQREKLVRMLRSTLRNYPRARLLRTSGVFGVLLDEQTSMHVAYSGRWSDADMRDLLALFAVWLVADAEYLRAGGVPLAGVLQTVLADSDSYSGRQV